MVNAGGVDVVRETPSTRVARARAVLETVPDPEIPVLSVVDLGIVRDVDELADGSLRVGLSPTYSGCPATATIREDVAAALERAGLGPVQVVDVLSPAWSSDWISEEGRRKLLEYGIAPPTRVDAPRLPVACPRCGSVDTERLSEFGSTPCKALYRCRACREPFDRFKCL
jgi:ring-1,2-phenylacetyl-CoA epoxidase subunit PaaD